MNSLRKPIVTSQPQQALQIDRSNRFGRNLAFLSCSGFPIDLVSGKGVESKAAVLGVGKAGNGFLCSSGVINAQWNLAPVVTSDGAGTGDFTYFALLDSSPETAVRAVFTQKGDGLGFPYTQSGLFVNSVDYTASSGTIGINNYSGAGWGCYATSVLDGNPHFYIVTRRAGQTYIYKDGVPLPVTRYGTQTTTIWRAGQKVAVGNEADGDLSRGYNKVIPFVGAMNTSVSDVEAISLSSNPWQVFNSTPKRLQTKALQLFYTIPLSTKSLSLSGIDTGILAKRVVFGNVSNLITSYIPPILRSNRVVYNAVYSMVVTPTQTTTAVKRLLQNTVATIAMSNPATALKSARIVQAQPTSYSLLGISNKVVANRVILSNTGNFNVVGIQNQTLKQYVIPTVSATYICTKNSAGLVFTGVYEPYIPDSDRLVGVFYQNRYRNVKFEFRFNTIEPESRVVKIRGK